MDYRRGKIYLANFNPSKGKEPGKIRPCLVVQSDLLNEVDHPTTMVVPLTTQLSDASPLRIRVTRREGLKEDSDLTLDLVRSIDNIRFTGGAIASLTTEETLLLDDYLKILLGIDN